MNKFVNAILRIGAGVICLGLVYLLIKQYRGVPASLWLYGSGIAGILLLLIAQKLPVHIKTNLILLLFSLEFTLYAIEFYLFIAGNPLDYRTPRFLAAQQQGIRYDKRTPMQVVAAERSQGQEAYPFIPPLNFQDPASKNDPEALFAFAGISRITTILCNENGSYTIYDSDRYGFHNPDEIWDTPQLDLLLLGDSFPHGACVPTDKNMGALLREEMPAALNLGISGSGSLSHLAILKEYGAKFQPKAVLWFYFEGNDLGDLVVEQEFAVLRRYLEEDMVQELPARQDEINQQRKQLVTEIEGGLKLTRWAETLATLRLFNSRRLLGLTRENIQPPENRTAIITEPVQNHLEAPIATADDGVDFLYDDGLPLWQQTMEAAQQSVASWDGELIVVYLPDYQRFNDSIAENILYRNEVLAILDELNIPVIDLAPVFASQPNPLSLFPFSLNGHYSEEGYALVVEEILGKLRKHAE